MRHGLEVGDAIRPRCRDQLRIRICRNPRLNIWSVVTNFSRILGSAHAADLGQTDNGIQSDQAGEQMLAGQIDFRRAVAGYVRANGSDFTILDQHIAWREGLAGDRMNRRAGKKHGFSARFTERAKAARNQFEESVSTSDHPSSAQFPLTPALSLR